jgi:hypothetical protein
MSVWHYALKKKPPQAKAADVPIEMPLPKSL